MKLRYKIASGFLLLIGIAVLALGLVLSYTEDCPPAAPLAGDVESMKAIVYRCYGSADVLEYRDIEKPTPTGNEVLVKVRAAAVNPYDWHYMRGSPYLMRLGSGIGTPHDSRLGVDFAGTVEAVGSEVTRFKPGDAVFGGRTGSFAEYLIIPEDRAIAHMPDNITFEQAASVGIAAVTALQALRDDGAVTSGHKVLINGASGGVGTFAVQIAKVLGAEVTGVCSTRNVDLVRSLGADHVFDYKQENYTESSNQYDVIIDMVGNHSLLANRRVLTPEGKVVLVGGPKGNWIAPLKNPLKAMLLSPFVDQSFGMMLATLDKEDFDILGNMMAEGTVTPVIDRRFPLSEVPDAIRYSEAGRARGKIIISIE